MGPRKLVTARPISAPYSSCHLRMLSGEPSKPVRLARTTTGRLPLAAFMARATLRDDCGKSVPDVQDEGPSAGTNPALAMLRDSRPIRHTGNPPIRASHTIALSALRHRAHRSNGAWSASVTARITDADHAPFERWARW